MDSVEEELVHQELCPLKTDKGSNWEAAMSRLSQKAAEKAAAEAPVAAAPDVELLGRQERLIRELEGQRPRLERMAPEERDRAYQALKRSVMGE